MTGYGRIYFKALSGEYERVHRVPRIGEDVEAIVHRVRNYVYEIISFDVDDVGHDRPKFKRVGGSFQGAITDAYEIVHQGGLRRQREVKARDDRRDR